MVCGGYEEQSTTCHEHNRRQTGNVSAAIIVIDKNAQAHRDQPAFFSNKKNETNFISLLTTHEVSRGDADALIVCAWIRSEWSSVLILLVYHWGTTYSSERKEGPEDQEKSSA